MKVFLIILAVIILILAINLINDHIKFHFINKWYYSVNIYFYFLLFLKKKN